MIQPITRRDFLKVSGGFTGLFATAGLLANVSEFSDLRMVDQRPRWTKETKTICSFDSCNCGLICYTDGEGNLSNLEGDPDNPVNKGAACAKGASLIQVRNGKEYGTINENRVQKVRYRAKGSSEFVDMDFSTAISQIAQKVAQTRASGFEATDANGNTVNRCNSIASFGGSTLYNEECHMLSKALRALGLVYVDNQDRYDSASAEFAVKATLGNDASSNNWTDISNSNAILAFGCSPYEAYAACASSISRTVSRGAKLIVVDPRFTRTAAKASLYVPMRSGADLIFLGGLINFILTQIDETPENFNLEYLVNYTNLAALVDPSYKGPGDEGMKGLFSGYNSITQSYDKASWSFQYGADGNMLFDTSLEDENCVFQVMKRHYERYSTKVVSENIGCDVNTISDAYTTFTATGAADKAGTIIHSMGAAQHTTGAQIIHALSIIQLLLGNMGIAGGGIHTIKGEGNTQGATDFGLCADHLPGYLPMPKASQPTLGSYLTTLPSDKERAAFISLLKSWYGDKANADNDFAYVNLPKLDDKTNYSGTFAFSKMASATIKGAFVWGQNLAVSAMNHNYVFYGLDRLDWLVVFDKWENETARFWERPGANASSINTEVYLFPTAASFEKEGSSTSSSRLVQWGFKAVNAPGDAKSEFEIIKSLVSSIKSQVTDSPVADLTWNYSDAQSAMKEYNGSNASGLLQFPTQLRVDGSTASGNYRYIGVITEENNLNSFEIDNSSMFPSGYVGNRAARAYAKDVDADGVGSALGLYSYYGFAWPQNQRILNNRASVDTNGRAANGRKAVIRQTASGWSGDVTMPGAPTEESGILPFETADGRAHLFCADFADGPLPEHYEPWEAPVNNALSSQNQNPVLVKPSGEAFNQQGTFASYPVVATTCRVTEHCMDGQSTRNSMWLVEMMPEAYAEIPRELAAEKDIQSGDMVKITSARASIQVRAMVTSRLKRFTIQGKKCDQIAIPWHWGFAGYASGESANALVPVVADPNSSTPEYKAFLVKIEKGDS